ncbi:proteasome inhibitor PI31 subunit-like [Lineus longissimus]|uniref:proteasome inhibitor PI31 subunit-like n=1 Tax=Lineus longissimus TaxID=88925 RepID=UPI002B4FAF71
MADSAVSSGIRGLETLFATCQHVLKSQNDALICFFHSFLISKGLKCVGHGEDGPNVKKTELLPDGWNNCQDVYILRYEAEDCGKYVLKVVKMDNALLVHLLRAKDEHMTSLNVKASDYTTGDYASYESAFKNSSDLEKKLKTEIWAEMVTPQGQSSSRAQGNRSRPEGRSDDPLRAGPVRGGNPMPPDWVEQGDPFSVGRGDLDPFGGHPGGMLVDPMRQGRHPGMGFDPSAGLPGSGRLPRGAVPPGARFDPFGPPGLGRGGPGRPGPDPDHMRPPDYDDMFM